MAQYSRLGDWGFFSEESTIHMARVEPSDVRICMTQIAAGLQETDEVASGFFPDEPLGWNHGTVLSLSWTPDWGWGRKYLREYTQGTPRQNTCEKAFTLAGVGVPIHSVNVNGHWKHGVHSVRLVEKIIKEKRVRLHTGHVLRYSQRTAWSAWGPCTHMEVEVEEVA